LGRRRFYFNPDAAVGVVQKFSSRYPAVLIVERDDG
jgi:hypothetical protein